MKILKPFTRTIYQNTHSKFNAGDPAFLIANDKPTEVRIDQVSICMKENELIITYDLNESPYGIGKKRKGFKDKELFKTKRELLNSLI